MSTSRLCKYHGRSCKFPGDCLNRVPRKYEGDGHMETIDPERLTLGTVVRHPYSNGSLPGFSDTVVLGIYVSYGSHRQKNHGVAEKKHFLTLHAAMADATRDDYVMVKLGRPMMYADNVFGSIPGWALKCEVYEASGPQMLDSFKVVVMSTGAYESRIIQEPLHSWKVLVNGDFVYSDLSEEGARATYRVYCQMAQGALGHKGGEKVTLICDGEKEAEYVGNMG